jgi:hypothetical protein
MGDFKVTLYYACIYRNEGKKTSMVCDYTCVLHIPKNKYTNKRQILFRNLGYYICLLIFTYSRLLNIFYLIELKNKEIAS